jgi:hypothetical protein
MANDVAISYSSADCFELGAVINAITIRKTIIKAFFALR